MRLPIRMPRWARLPGSGHATVALAVLLATVLAGWASGDGNSSGGSSGGGTSGGDGSGGDGSGGASRREDRDARNKAESDVVNTSLGRLAGVLRVDGGYTRDASNARGAVVLSITVRPGTDLRQVADNAVRSVWLSRLDPIASMTVTVGSEGKPAAAIDRHADFAFDRGQLTAGHGPRPPTS